MTGYICPSELMYVLPKEKTHKEGISHEENDGLHGAQKLQI